MNIDAEGPAGRRRGDSVFFPAPEGEESTSISPRRVMPRSRPAAPSISSLQILHLLAELLDQSFHLKADIGELDVVPLGAQGVGFALQLLGQELEPPADGTAL